MDIANYLEGCGARVLQFQEYTRKCLLMGGHMSPHGCVPSWLPSTQRGDLSAQSLVFVKQEVRFLVKPDATVAQRPPCQPLPLRTRVNTHTAAPHAHAHPHRRAP
jgi:hypothetical protein